MTLRHLSLCTGYGGLDLAVHAVIGGELVAVAEFDKNAAKICEARFDVPNLGDITTLDWAEVGETYGPIDIITAGYPCQPFSFAGKRKGTSDARHIWPHIAEAVRTLRPRLVVLENVYGHLSKGFAEVQGALAAARYDATWTCLRAGDVGAPHQRERVFIVAADTSRERHGGRQERRVVGGVDGEGEGQGAQRERARELAGDRSDEAAADTDRARLEGRVRPEPERGGERTAGQGRVDAGRHAASADTDLGTTGGDGRDASGPRGTNLRTQVASTAEWGKYEPAIRRWEAMTRPAPPPSEPKENGEGARLAPRFVEWMMGLPDGWVTDVDISRSHQLKALGNGVVPQQAYVALTLLMERVRW